MPKVNTRILKVLTNGYNNNRHNFLEYITLTNVLILAIPLMLTFLLVLVLILYNRFARLEQDIFSARSSLVGAIQMRINLLPVFVNTTSTFQKHEKKMFFDTTKMRVESLDIKENLRGVSVTDLDIKSLSKVNSQGTDLLNKLLAVAENYPDLKSSGPFMLLMQKMTDVELKVYEARMAYNSSVNAYEKEISTLPNMFLAVVFGFHSTEYYSSDEKPEWIHPSLPLEGKTP